ncbi:restriction endonuclease-related protein [Streptomyces antibioticus]|uniref:restriction endonuclease-related protein n=1 Tax=Streptomyces antibioticus TaxID=1890 RepID=UPI0033B8098A
MVLKECENLRLRREQALTACCMAAAAEADLQLQPARRAAILMDCLAVLRAAHPAADAAQWGMGEFRRALRGPLAPLLPAASESGDGFGALCLFDGDGLVRDALQDLCREHLVPQAALERHWPWVRVRAEQEERRLYEVLRRLEPQEYRRARALLAESPAGPVRVLRRAWDQLWMRFDFFEAVSDWPWCHLDGWWYPCPRCRWPMRVVRRGGEVEVRCEAHRTRGVHYRLGLEPTTAGAAPLLVGTGKEAGAVVGLPASTEHLALSRPVWRYGVLPTLLEVELRDELQDLDHVQVQMWPGESRPDEYDLRITVAPPGRRAMNLRVDAKAWESVEALACALTEREPKPYALTIVLPDHQDHERHYLQERLSGRRIKVTTVSRLVARVKQACAGGR